MCGISGIIGRISPGDRAVVESMNTIQAHRGPDMDKVCEYNGAVLGHRRLSIIDLDNRSSQPMESIDGRYVIVFNGEIYNYKEIKSRLLKDYDFKTESDTEVLLASFITWGKECLARFVGMFAFCIYDTLNKEAFLARDHFGQKPIFLYQESNRLVFSSEIKAILATGVKPVPDYETWSRYLISASYDDDSATFFKGISQLIPGEYAIWDIQKGLRKYKYYSLTRDIGNNKSDIVEVVRMTRELLVHSAKIHMRSDVPVGVSLSGGLDSSVLLACLNLSGDINKHLRCVSLDYADSLSESMWIESAASYYDLKSIFETFTKNEFLNSIKPLMWHLEAPIGGLPNCALAGLMSRAGKLGIKVIQDGTGLDEAFAGYHNHHNLFLGEMIEKGDSACRRLISEYAENWGVTEEVAKISALNEMKNSITAIDGTIPVRIDLLSPDFRKKFSGEVSGKDTTGSKLYDSLIDYLQARKIPRNTRMKDRVSMAYSIELRLPFLDHNLVEYALSLPEHFHFLYGRTKSMVREAMKGSMDEKVRIAPKRSIQAPQEEWLRTEPMAGYVQSIIYSQSFADRGFYDLTRVHNAFKEFCEGKCNNSFFVWQWINVEEWFRTFIDNDSTKAVFPLYN